MTNTINHPVGIASPTARVRHESELDRFAAYLNNGAIIVSACAYSVGAEGHESERSFCPQGGLTETVYRLGRTADEKAILAIGIIENALLRRGYPYRKIHSVLSRYDPEGLRGLIEGV